MIPFGVGGERFVTPWRVYPGPGEYENKANEKIKNNFKCVFESKVPKFEESKVVRPSSMPQKEKSSVPVGLERGKTY